ncbi:MAG: hypothetical protein ACKPEO_07645 [Sphaerospermopsis kisseleviana]
MHQIIPILDKIAFLAFVVATMFGTGLKLTVQQIWQPLRNIRLVVLSCYTAKLYNPNILNSCLTGKMPVPLIQIKCTTA